MRGDPPLVARRRLGFVGQEEAIWNRSEPFEGPRECAYCRDPWHHVDLITLSLLDDPFEGAEPMVLIGGLWLHTDCAEDMAQAITPSPGAYPYVNEERRARLRAEPPGPVPPPTTRRELSNDRIALFQLAALADQGIPIRLVGVLSGQPL